MTRRSPSKRKQRLARKRKAQQARIRRQQKSIKRAARQVKRKMLAGKPRVFAGAAFGVPVFTELPPSVSWEVTVAYSTSDEDVDITVRVETPPVFASGAPVTMKDVQGAVWRAALGLPVTLFTIQTVDWTRNAAGTYSGSGGAVDLRAFRAMMRRSEWRTAPVEEGRP